MAAVVNPQISSGTESVAGWNYTPITSSTTTVVKNGPGIFGGIYCTNAGTSWTATVYDNTAGSGQALTQTITLAVGANGIVSQLGVNVNIGITVVTAGTAGACYIMWQ